MDKEPLLSKDSHYSSNDEQPLVSDNDKVQLLPNKAELELGNEPDGLEDDEDNELTLSVRSRTAVVGGLDTGEKGTSNLATLIHIFKGNIGTGVLSLPAAIKYAGIIAGPVSLAIIALMAIHCMHLLVKCSHHYCKRLKKDAMAYGDVAEECTKPILGHRAHYAKFFVNFFLVLTQFGFCSIYFVFVASTIVEVFGWEHSVDKRLVIVIIAIPVVLLSYIRSLEKLAYISVLSNILCLYGLVTVFQYLVRNVKSPTNYPAVSSIKNLPVFFAMALFSFEGIGVVLPLENEMSHPEDFGKVLNVGMGVITCLFVSMGTMGYLAFGDDIQGSVTLNLPDNALYDSVKIVYAVAMFLTYFLQFYVPIQILLPPLLSRYQKRHGSCFEYTFRTMLVLFTAALAAGIPLLGDFIALIGAMASSGLAIIFPPLFHILTFRKHGLNVASWIKDILIMSIGIFGFLVGTYTAVANIVSDFQNQEVNINANATSNATFALPALFR